MTLKLNKLKNKFGKNIFFQESLSKFSWFNLGGPAKVFFKPESTEQLIDFLKFLNTNKECIVI